MRDAGDRVTEEVSEHEHFRTHGTDLKAPTGHADFGFPVVDSAVVRVLGSECLGVSRRVRRRSAGLAWVAIHGTVIRAVAAVGCADSVVSRFACGPDPGGPPTFPEQIVEADRWIQ